MENLINGKLKMENGKFNQWKIENGELIINYQLSTINYKNMEYNFKLPLSFEQLLSLVLQMPKIEQKRLILAIDQEGQKIPKIQTKTVAEIKAPTYQYPQKNPKKLVGLWQEETLLEELLKSDS